MNGRTAAPGPARPGELIQIDRVFPLFGKPGLRWLGRVVMRALSLDAINRAHAAGSCTGNGPDFLRAALDSFGVRFEIGAEELARIPPEGPVVVVSNHPFGGLDAIVFTAVLAGLRKDARVLANYLLADIPQLRSTLLPVDPFGGLAAAKRNVLGMQRALSHLEGGGLLGVFPSGTVSHFQWRRMRVEDPEWTPHLHRLVRRSKATVVPVFFPGRNSLLFQLAGLVHPLLRTALIPREAVLIEAKRIVLCVGGEVLEAIRHRFRFPKVHPIVGKS